MRSTDGKRRLPVLPPDFEDPKLPRKVFSPSQYGLYKKCGRAYEFRYPQGIDARPRGAMFKGTTIHKGAEFALQHVIDTKTLPPLEAARAVVADSFEAGKETVERWDEGETVGSAKDTTIRGYTAYHLQALAKMHPEKVEEPFAVKIGTVPVIGYIDLIDRQKEFEDAGDPGRRLVADLKYSSAAWSQADVDSDPQFTVYSIATNLDEVRVDNLVEYKAGPALKQRWARRDAVAKEVLIEDYEQVADFIKRGIFPMAPVDSWQCTEKWCGYWSRCRGRKR